SAGLTGRTPRYGYHLDERRRATLAVNVTWTPRAFNDWGALGGIVGRLTGDYWQVSVLLGIERVPGSGGLKDFGSAVASYGSVALFHMAGITPEAQFIGEGVIAGTARHAFDVGESDIRAFQRSYTQNVERVDVVVFSAPQLSLMEMHRVAEL